MRQSISSGQPYGADAWAAKSAQRLSVDLKPKPLLRHFANIAIYCYNACGWEEKPVFQQIIWNEEPGGNLEHIEEHGLAADDVEYVLANPESRDRSHSSGVKR